MKVALAQYQASEHVDANFAWIEGCLREASAQHVELLVLPETCLFRGRIDQYDRGFKQML